ncbi:LysR family transcriptional regulator [Methylocapsa sp. S129]|uniref:LysR family transcriptional regulator n=1 Tax=Methylocapsa sp. S129 TaxID=1641869 RepID=UPI00131AA160|nr:LysR family transcriptional regulator [Methylocapsa sp. S129]
MDHPFRTGAPSISKLAIEDGSLLSGRYWGELRTFLAVAKAKSLNRAADELGVSRMTAGREIRRLQDAIGAQLVVFSKTGAALTRRGEGLAQALQRVDQEIHTLTNDLRAELGQAEGTVRLSVTDGIGVIFVVPGLRRLALDHPRIRVELKSPQNYLSLVENQTDLMVGFARESHQDLTSVRMGTFRYMPLVSRSYVERMGLPTPDNLQNHLFIDSDRYSSKVEVWSPWRNLVERGTVSHRCDAPITYAMMVKAGLGIGLLASYNVQEPAFIRLDLDCTVAIPLYLTALTERLQAKPVQVVFDLLLSLLSADNPWFAKQMTLEVGRDSPFNEGYQRLFNL